MAPDAPDLDSFVVRHRATGWVREIARKDEDAEIEAGESQFMVDRRAIAGAIAWEALMNVRRSMRAYGPGKVHAWTWSGKTVAEEVEDKGDLPKKTNSEREELLATSAGSITSIGTWFRVSAAR